MDFHVLYHCEVRSQCDPWGWKIILFCNLYFGDVLCQKWQELNFDISNNLTNSNDSSMD